MATDSWALAVDEQESTTKTLLKGVYEMGFNRPSKIQENALPMMLAEPPQNLIAQSQSGTGKTAAFVLAMLSHVDPSLKWPQGCAVKKCGTFTKYKELLKSDIVVL
ncbi:hypothetical protein cypCar_00026979 [Cyprinus carpio]|nr:hypothetical protein cypCar_00026979 [Cyprinus carpio]